MRNRWGVEVKKGHWVSGRTSRGDAVQGRVAKIERTGDYARAYGPRVILDNGMTLGVDDISQTLGPMTVEDDGTVRQNPDGRFAKLTDHRGIDMSLIGHWSDLAAYYSGSDGNAWTWSAATGKWSNSGELESFVKNFYQRFRGVLYDYPRANPLTRVRIKSPPQRPAGNSSPPSKRLMTRRKKTAKAPAGVYANPVVKPIRNRKAALTHGAPDTMRTWNDHYIVQRSPDPDAKAWDSIGVFPKRVDAENFARNYARQHSTQYVRVVTPD